MKTQSIRAWGWRALLILALTMTVGVAACTVRLISSYDPVTDQEVTALQKQVDQLLVKLDHDPTPAYSTVANSYESIWVDFKVLYVRNEARPKNQITTQQLDQLRGELQDLETANKKEVLNQAMLKPAGESIQQTFRAILQLELAKKETGSEH
ncbi:MAG: hypothetical protein ACRD22_00260 [Terriglobia bacterium]